MTDYYAVLGVADDAENKVIKESYHRLAKEYHPDIRPGDKAAAERFKIIAEAWDVLGKPDKRAKYDQQRTGQKQRQSFQQKNKKRETPMGKVDLDNLMGQFDAFFSKGMTPPPSHKKEANPLDATDLFEKFMGIKKKGI